MRTRVALSYRPSSASRQCRWRFVAALTFLGSAACSDATTELRGAASVSIAPSELSLTVGDVATLTAQALDAKRQRIDVTYRWTSANFAVATVSNTGVVTAIGPGSTTMSVLTGAATATTTITVQSNLPPVAIFISPLDLVLATGGSDRFTAHVVNRLGQTLNAAVEWLSANPAIATVGKSDGVVTALAIGSTTVTAAVGSVSATVNVTVEPENYLAQWASGASASSQYTTDDWSAAQAIGAPNVLECEDDPRAWAPEGPDLDWLEVTYAQPVRPTRIHIYETWAVGSIVKVEVKDIAGNYHAVYSALPVASVSCLRVLAIAVTNVAAKVVAVRITVDQRERRDWTEIDAVRLSGLR